MAKEVAEPEIDWDSFKTPENLTRGEEFIRAIEHIAQGREVVEAIAPRAFLAWEHGVHFGRLVLFPQGPVEATMLSEEDRHTPGARQGVPIETIQPMEITRFDILEFDDDGRVWLRGRSPINHEGFYMTVHFAPRQHLIALHAEGLGEELTGI